MKLQHQNQQNEISMPMAQQADNKQGIYNKNNSHASQQPGSSSSGYISMYSKPYTTKSRRNLNNGQQPIWLFLKIPNTNIRLFYAFYL